MTRVDDAAGTATADGGATPTEVSGTTIGGPNAAAPSRGRRALLVAGLTVVVTLPLLVALVALRTPRWYPLLDLAMTELRVRDVGTGHTPLVGLVGRLSSNGNQGSHLGPLSFWSLAPTYRALGGSAWSLLVGVVVLNTTAIALTLWIALRRGGTALAVGFAAGLAVLVHLYGTMVLTEPWNPYLPVMWWMLTLVALWAVLCDDLPMLPVAVFAASFCLQTHISYGILIAGFGAAALAAFAVRAVRLRGDRPALRRLLGWSGLSLAVAVVLWLPPLIDQATGDPGNMSIVAGHFMEPDDEPIGVERGAELFAVHLNPWRLLAGQPGIDGSVVPAALYGLIWVGAALATWRLVPRGDGPPVHPAAPARGDRPRPRLRPGLVDADPRVRVVLPDALGVEHHDAHGHRHRVDGGDGRAGEGRGTRARGARRPGRDRRGPARVDGLVRGRRPRRRADPGDLLVDPRGLHRGHHRRPSTRATPPAEGPTGGTS